MTKDKIKIMNERLDEHYGTDIKCYLDHNSAYELLVATILSAQCTDARVNIVTKDLFLKYPSIESFANADLKELENDIKPTGFHRNKAKNIIGCCKKLHEEYNDEVPSDIDLLTSLPGVGRKTANVIRGNIYNIQSVVVDTHVKRLSYKLGLTKETDPVKIEFELMKKIPKNRWILINKQFIAHGRSICKAINPNCDGCFLSDICPKK